MKIFILARKENYRSNEVAMKIRVAMSAHALKKEMITIDLNMYKSIEPKDGIIDLMKLRDDWLT
jgi:hypothetical protein